MKTSQSSLQDRLQRLEAKRKATGLENKRLAAEISAWEVKGARLAALEPEVARLREECAALRAQVRSLASRRAIVEDTC